MAHRLLSQLLQVQGTRSLGTKPLLALPSRYPRSGSLALLSVVLLATACSPGAPTAEAYTVTDSAGITIVENQSPQWTTDGWTIDEDPEWVFGRELGSREGVPLETVAAIRALSGGRVAILDQGPNNIFIVDGGGETVEVFGGDGDGPGEFRYAGSLHVCADTVLVPNRGKVSAFVVGSGFVGFMDSPEPRPANGLRGVSSDCNLLLYQPNAGRLGAGDTGVYVWPTVWFNRTLDRSEIVYADSISGVRWAYFPGTDTPQIPRFPPWQPEPDKAVLDSLVIQGIERLPELRWHLPSGRIVKIVRWSQRPAPVTKKDENRYEEKRLRLFRDAGFGPVSEFRLPALDFWETVPSIKPYFDQVLVDDADYVWVLRDSGDIGWYDAVYPPFFEQPPQLWFVFDPVGRWLGEVTMPANFALHTVADGLAVGVMKDEFDVQTVRAYRIERH